MSVDGSVRFFLSLRIATATIFIEGKGRGETGREQSQVRRGLAVGHMSGKGGGCLPATGYIKVVGYLLICVGQIGRLR